MKKMVKKFASLAISMFLVLSTVILPNSGITTLALTEDATTYYTERGTTIRYTSATADDYTAKVAELEAEEYTKYSSNTIAVNAKSATVGADNLFSVYLNSDKTELKHIAFYPTTKALHITTQKLNENDLLAVNDTPEYAEICEPLFIQIMPDETGVSGGTSGMSYALRLSDGRFIIIDGGIEMDGSTIQADTLYATLNKYNTLDSLTIAAWVFTHAHSDHITTFTSLVNKYSDSIKIEQLIYNYPCDDDIVKESSMVDKLTEGGIIYEQRKAIAEHLPDVKISTPYGGDVYKFADAELEFYLTPTDMFPVMCYTGDDFNTSSMIFKIKIQDQEILITADSSDYALVNVALPRFGTALSSDMVQMVHHGITYASGEFYELIGAEVAFWPIISDRVADMMKQEQNIGIINAPSTKEIILSSLGTRAITLPYTPAENGGLFTTPSGYTVDDELYTKQEVTKYGDILNEDITPWARSANSYPLNNGGSYMTWGSVKKSTSTTNGSDTALYFNTSFSTVYTPLYGLEQNTTYSLSFDYMAASTTELTNGIFSKFGISGVNEDSAGFTYNIYQGKSKTVNANEVYGTENGWNHIEVTFTTDDTVYDEYYLSFYVTVGAISGSYKGYIDNVSIAQSKKTYYYHYNDYETLTGDTQWLGYGNNLTLSVTENSGEVIGNNKSLKITSDYSGLIGTAITDVVVPAGTNARVSFNYKVTKGIKGWGKVGYVGFNSGTGKYNWANINEETYTEAPPQFYAAEAAATVRSFVNTVKKKDSDSGYMGFFWNNSKATTIIVDDVKIAEIIGTVNAISADEQGGTATVQNKRGSSYTDFAVNETAVFTATPNDGYYFDGWYDESGAFVSGNATYEMTATTDTELTARFKKGYKQDFEDYTVTSSECYGGCSIDSAPVGGAVSGNNVMKYDASTIEDYSTAKSRFVVNIEAESIKLNEYAALGEKITVSFKYKVGTGNDVRLYFHTGTTRTNAAAHVVSYGKADLSTTSDWQEYSHSFTLDYTQTKQQLTLTIFVGTPVTGQAPATLYIDDVTISKEDYIDNFEYKGNAIRTTGNQALRYKYAIDKSVLSTTTASGYRVTEYGFIAAKTENLVADPTLDTEGVKIAPAYVSDYSGNISKDIIFSETEDTKCISAALYNIGVKSSGETDYNYYDKMYSVRVYVVFENEIGDKKVIYTETESSSVFETVNAVFNADATSDQIVNDKADVKAFVQSNSDLLEIYTTLYPEYSDIFQIL